MKIKRQSDSLRANHNETVVCLNCLLCARTNQERERGSRRAAEWGGTRGNGSSTVRSRRRGRGSGGVPGRTGARGAVGRAIGDENTSLHRDTLVNHL